MLLIYKNNTDKIGFLKNRLLIFLFFILSSVFSLQVSAQNYIVNSNLDAAAVNLVTGETAVPGQITLRSAVQAATAQPGAHIITFSGAVVSPINLTLGQITLGNSTNGNNITITGPGMNLLTVNQTTENRIFSTGTGAVTILLQDITFNYAGPAVTPYSGGGGAIIAGGAGAASTFINCRFTNFQRQIGNGGAISQSSSLTSHNLTITNCIFINNRCGGAGGAVSFNSQGGTATITGCTFDNNHTGVVGANTGGDGGALSVTGGGSGGTYLIERNTFINNQVENPGGHAGAIMSTNGTSTIRFNRFIGNTCLNTTNPPLANIVGQAGGATTHVTIADNNWWGVNTGPGPNDATALAAGAVMTLTKWLQLKTTASPNPICNTPAGLGNTTTVTTSFLSNSANEAIAVGNIPVLIGLPVTWGPTTLGSLSAQQGTIQASGTATATFTSNGTGGTATVNTQVDNVPAGETSPARANITVNTLPTVTNPTNFTSCVGGTATFTSTITGVPAPTIVWRIGTTALVNGLQGSGSTVSGQGTATLTITNVQPGDAAANYNVQASNQCGLATSGNATLTVNEVTGGTVAADQTICTGGDPVAFTQTGASTGSGTLTYQWQSSTTSCAAGFTDIAGATATTYDPPAGLAVTTYYRRVTTSTLNTVPCTANSNCITVTVNSVTGGTVAADQTICSAGNPAAFTQTVASTGSGVLTYQWQSSTTSCAAGFTDIAGATGTTYDVPAGLTVTTFYRRVTTSTLNAVTCTANSNCVTVSVNDVTGGTVGSDQTICSAGDPAAFTQSVASSGTGTLTYQWQSSTTSCVAGFSDIAGATATTFDPPAGLLVTTYYRRVTTSTLNTVPCTANSNCITVTINNVTGGTVGADQTFCSGGDPAAFTESVASTGSGTLTYQWQSSTTSCVAGFTDIAGATGTTYDPPAGLLVTTYYRRVTTSTFNALPCTANSNCITVSINAVTGGTIAADQTICSGGDPAAFTESVASTGSGTLTYQWQSSTTSCVAGFTDIAGATATTYDAPAGLTVTTYFRRITTSTLNTVPCTANSNCITVSIAPNNTVTLTSAPGTDNQTVLINTPITNITYATTGATGATFSGLPPGVNGSWSGNVVTISGSPTAAGTYNYIVTLTGGCGIVTASGTITVTVCDITLTSAPGTNAQTICFNTAITNITYSTTSATGATFAGLPAGVTGSWSASVVTISGTPTVTGTFNYTVTPTGGGCTGTVTATGSITVNPIPDVNQPANQVVCNNAATSAVTFSGSVPGTTFNWTNSDPSIGLAASGTGNIASFTATNTSNAPVVATVTVTPSTGGGAGGLIPELLYYKFDGSGTSVPNLASAPPAGTATATLMGGLTQGGTAICNGTIIGTGASSTTDYLNTGWAPNLGTGSWTISFKSENITPSTTLFYVFGDVNTNSFRCFTNGVAGANNWWLRGAGLTDVPLNGGATVAPHTNTFVYDAALNQVRAYLDGVLVNTVAQSAPNVTGSGPFKVNGYSSNVGSPANGHYDEFRVFNRALTPAEILSLNGCPAAGPTCTGTPKTFTYTVNPTPTVNAVGNQIVCNGSTTTAVNFSGAVAGTVYNWTNNNTSIGLAASGAGNIASFTAINTGTTPVVATITVTPSYTNGGTTCTGTPTTFTITVNPTPDVNQPANQVVCNGAPTAPVNFTGSVAGTTYSWTNNTPSIGLAASGTGDIASFNAINTGTAPVVATITVTPSTGGGGTPLNFTNCGASGITGPSQAQANAAYTGTPLAGQVTIIGSGIQQWTVPSTGVYTITAAGASGGYTPLAIGGRGRIITTDVNLVAGQVLNILVGQEGGRAAFSSPGYSGGGGGGTFIINQTTNTPILISGGGGGAGEGNAGWGSPVLNGVDASAYNVTNGGNGTGFAGSWSVVGIGGSGGGGGTAPGNGGAGGGGYSGNGQTPGGGAGQYGGNPGISYLSGGSGGINRDWFGGTTSDIPGGFGGGAGAGTHSNYEANGGGAGGYSGGGGSNSRVGAGGGGGNLYTGTYISSGLNTGMGYVTISSLGASTCTGTPKTFTITVNPIPNAVATPASQTICSGSAITTIALTGNVSGTVYNWTRDNPGVTGIANSGTGDISGTLTNSTNAPVTVTFTITPTYTNGGTTCTGTPITATVLVNPIPSVVATPSSQTICSGSAITPIVLSSGGPGSLVVTLVSGTWADEISLQLVDASNTTVVSAGPFGLGVNYTSPPIAATNGPYTFNIEALGAIQDNFANWTINCNGNPIASGCIRGNNGPACGTATGTYSLPGINCLGSGVAGTTYSWIRDNVATVTGMPASGSGSPISGTLTNTTNAPITVTFTITPTANGCSGAPVTATVLVNPTPVVNAVPNQVVCNGAATAPVNFTSPTTGGTIVYNWTNNTPAIGLAASGNGNIASFTATNTTNAPLVATITVTPTYTNGGVSCVGTPITFTITVNPTATVNPVPNRVLCNGATSTAINFTSPTTGGSIVYNWTNSQPSIGLAASGSGNIPSFVAVNVTNAPVVATITVTPTYTNGGVSCVGTPISFTITVNPPPIINPVPNQVVCNNTATAPVNFTTPSTGGTVVYNWTNNNTTIGLAASGTGNIPSFIGTNTTNAPNVATITVTMIYTNGGISCVSLPVSFTITVNPTPIVNQVPNQVVCNGSPTAPVNFSSPTTGGTIVYNWTNTGAFIGLGPNGTGNIPSFIATNSGTTPVTATIMVIPTYTAGGVSCTGPAMTFTITVNPTPTVNQPANQVLCHGSPTAPVIFTGSVPGTVYSWVNNNTSIGLGGGADGNIPSFIATNVTNVPQVATITVTPTYTNGGVTCTGTSRTFTITVNPIPSVSQPANQTVCAGATVTTVFSGPVAGTVYAWTNTNTAIGLVASGTGNLNFVSTNTTGAPITGTITVTPRFTNGGVTCTGNPVSFTITVNPVPTVNQVANQVRCNGTATAAINFSGSVAGAVYNWTNNNVSIGLAATGTGNIPSFTATNITNAPVVATITVTPVFTSGGVTCTGPTMSFTITVNPTPSVNAIANQTACNGVTINTIVISGPVAGTVFTWTNNNTSIGLAGAGTGNIPAFMANNTTNAPITATITVTPTYTNGGVSCSGTSTSFTITVNPTPTVNAVSNQSLCNGATTAAINFTGAVAGTVYNWTNSNTAIGLAASGTGNIAAFTAINTTNAPITATITVTPSAAGCTGSSTSFTITVNPTPTVNQPANQTVCDGSSTLPVVFTGGVAGTLYSWTNNSPQIGLGISGTGNIPAFIAKNATPFPVVATITVTPTFNNGGVICTGASVSFTITVNPQPNIVFNMPPRACLTDTLITLKAFPVGGTWTGAGVSGNTFSAAAAGLGVHLLTYTFTNSFGCTAVSYFNITVNDCKERHNVFATAIRIYPNPSSGRFNISFLSDLYKEFNVRVVTSSGQELKTYHFNNLRYGSVIPMDLTGLPGGTYWLQIYNASERAHFPFVIVR